jgi:Fe2+ or Zn2+ uptake regulation protein
MQEEVSEHSGHNHSATDTCSHSPERYMGECIEVMKSDGARITKTRRAVIECLSTSSQALTPQDIMKHIKSAPNTSEGIDLASVYRILKYMSELGLVHQVGPNGGFFPCTHTHCGVGIHLITRCGACENTVELHVPEDMTSSLLWYLKHKIDFVPEEHVLEIKGTCKNCVTHHESS